MSCGNMVTITGSQCDDSELRYNEREGTARTVQSIESEPGQYLGHGKTASWPDGTFNINVGEGVRNSQFRSLFTARYSRATPLFLGCCEIILQHRTQPRLEFRASTLLFFFKKKGVFRIKKTKKTLGLRSVQHVALRSALSAFGCCHGPHHAP